MAFTQTHKVEHTFHVRFRMCAATMRFLSADPHTASLSQKERTIALVSMFFPIFCESSSEVLRTGLYIMFAFGAACFVGGLELGMWRKSVFLMRICLHSAHRHRAKVAFEGVTPPSQLSPGITRYTSHFIHHTA